MRVVRRAILRFGRDLVDETVPRWLRATYGVLVLASCFAVGMLIGARIYAGGYYDWRPGAALVIAAVVLLTVALRQAVRRQQHRHPNHVSS